MGFLGYLGELEAMLPEGSRGGYREGCQRCSVKIDWW